MSNPIPETLEQAREMLLRYKETLAQRDQQIETLTAEKAENASKIEELRTLNQQLFLRASQGTSEPEPEPEQVESLSDYAKRMKGVIL